MAGEEIDLLGLEDLVNAKKTQRDKDWPMIRRLVEQNYYTNTESKDPKRIAFWLRELRTPELLSDIVQTHPVTARLVALSRPAIHAAFSGYLNAISQALD